MPRTRLDHDERKVISSGLATGLGYAEIARRLSRPTSTISREIARNGGPHGYRADHAHRATARRAHRSRTGRPAAPSGTDRAPAVVGEFEDRFAELIILRGLPRVAAKILAHLYVTDSGSRTAAELAEHLQVSAASISKAVRYLESQELVQRDREDRRDRYTVGAEGLIRTWKEALRMNAMWRDAALDGARLMGADTPAGARLDELGRFFRFVVDVMESATDRWPERPGTRHPT
ncbi:GbsR/MarR family transcriptional regulator [Pseudonocardia sp. TRM90224]|uniref:GbsR/MarR family transcriptional regulator n=1 Tax=Pseudonocardia sp. TRM90224 TaxID=2812678 RepID=UPI001E5BC397|nr:MarR family transcriptional regulator [Pseudonocardia sp. TRM90224]